MLDKPNVCILTGYGINADYELEYAFEQCKAKPKRIFLQHIFRHPKKIHDYRILAFPGGFSFGDHLGSGKVLAHLVKQYLGEDIRKFIEAGKGIIGICNGFQVLVKSGILPNLNGKMNPEVSLIHNENGVFEDSWIDLECNQSSRCVWTKGLHKLELPIRNGEGRFYIRDENVLHYLSDYELIALRYRQRNPNGSLDNIAGITDKTGNILGLMPHPETFLVPQNHPEWTRLKSASIPLDGLNIIQNGVNHFISG